MVRLSVLLVKNQVIFVDRVRVADASASFLVRHFTGTQVLVSIVLLNLGCYLLIEVSVFIFLFFGVLTLSCYGHFSPPTRFLYSL